MISLTTKDAEIVVEWEGRELLVWLIPKDAPGCRIQLTEHQIENIQRAARKVRTEKWITSKENGS